VSWVAARPHLEQGMQLYDPQRHRTHAALYSGHDPGVCCRMQTAQSLWFLGYPDQAVASIQAALGLCRKVAFWRQNPKMGSRKINDLGASTFLFSVICDRAGD
jgi:hypothetical protein